MSEVAFISHGLAAVAWLLLLLLLLNGWRGRLQGGLLVIATLISVPWALRAALHSHGAVTSSDWWYQSLEVARSVAWLIFLAHLLEPAIQEAWVKRGWLWKWALPIGSGVLLLGIELGEWGDLAVYLPPDVAILGHIGFAVGGFFFIEQLFRRTHPQQRWATKFLYLGLGLLFGYDFFLYADALLFKQMDPGIWQARGFVNTMAVPLLAVAAARNPKWSVEVFVSRQITQYSTAIFGAGIYLLFMAGVGYYIREFGGTWGTALHATFFAGAGVLLATLLFSGQLRAKVRVFLSKHFYHAKYDYRQEWLRFTRTLSIGEANEPPRTRAIRAVAEIVDSVGGLLWIRSGPKYFSVRASWNMVEPMIRREPVDGSLITFLDQRRWVIDLKQYAATPEIYLDLILPDWLGQVRQAWLVVPLSQGQELNGFLVLAQGNAHRALNWEDHDLLKTAGGQVAGYVALLESSEALSEARQFEAFHRLSAYVVHDLKNIAAQLALVVANAGRHKANPAFVEDALGTVSNATGRMNRLLTQLRTERASGRITSLALAEAAQQAIAVRIGQLPKPILHLTPGHDPWVRVDRDRLIAILEHLIQNAQEATGPKGKVEVRIRSQEHTAVVEIRDDGCGMDERFIRERLFRPFTTTKGNAGMGIGVYESREFALGAGGELTVDSRPQKGTLFSLYLPRVENPVIPVPG